MFREYYSVLISLPLSQLCYMLIDFLRELSFHCFVNSKQVAFCVTCFEQTTCSNIMFSSTKYYLLIACSRIKNNYLGGTNNVGAQ